jgi:hypothetical protein
MATVVSATEIPPGGEGKIKVKVSTRGRKGNLRKTVVVQSNDPQQPRYVLKIKGIVEVIAAFDPDRLNLKNIAKGKTVSQTVKLSGSEADKLKITELVSSKPEELTAKLIEEEGKPAVLVTFKAGDQAGRISARLTGKTNLKAPQEIFLYVYGQITDDLVAERPFVFFPGHAGGESGSLLAQTASILTAPLKMKNHAVKLKVSSLAGKVFKITGVEDPEGNVIGTAMQENEEWQVYLMLAKKPKAPRGIIRILTDRDDQPAIEVRYNARTSLRPVPTRPPPGIRPGQPGRHTPVIRSKKDGRVLRQIPNLRQKVKPLKLPGRKTVVPIKKHPPQPKK